MDKKFFYIEKKHILYTNDDWSSVLFNEDDSIKNLGYDEEKDASKIHIAKLKHNFGPKLADIILDEYNKIDNEWFKYKKNHLDSKDGYGAFFEIFSISVLHNISYQKAIADHLIIGSHDGKIDTVFFDQTSVVFYQVKLGNLTDDNTLQLMKDNVNEYIKTKTISDPISSDLLKYLKNHYEKDICGKDFDYKTISYNSNKSENISPDDIYNSFLQKLVERNKIIFKNSIEITKSDSNHFASNVINNNEKEVFVFAKADLLIDTLEKHIESEDNLDYLFVDNVRGRLNRNASLIQTIKNEPELFCFYNNGVSIVGDFNVQSQNPTIVVKNPIIINGQQTVVSLFAAKKEKIDISKVYVPVFLKSVPDEEKLRKIAKYNNTQSKISSIDLMSIDHNLRLIQSSLVENMLDDFKNSKECFYLDIVRNGKNRHKASAKQLFGKDYIISGGDFVKLYSVINCKEELGTWKNNLDTNLKKKYKNGFDVVNKEVAFKICKTIHDSKVFIGGNNNYKIADLAIQFLKYYGYSFDEIKLIIDYINNDSDKKNINRANIYREKDAIDSIRKAISDNNLNNLFDSKEKPKDE